MRKKTNPEKSNGLNDHLSIENRQKSEEISERSRPLPAVLPSTSESAFDSVLVFEPLDLRDEVEDKYEILSREDQEPTGRYVYAVSDGSGLTSQRVIKAALTQFKSRLPQLYSIGDIRSIEQVKQLIRKVQKNKGIIIYTMVSPELRQAILDEGRKHAVPTVDILGPILTRLSNLLELSPSATPGLFSQIEQDYYQRISAINFAVKHDDGRNPAGLDKAEIILVGISRTCKTPLSIYLSYRGWRVANVPLILGIELPSELFKVDPRRIIGLQISSNRLRSIRLERFKEVGEKHIYEYVDLDRIREEIKYANRVCNQNGWTMIDMTSKSIEEATNEICKFIYQQTGVKKGSIKELG